MVLLLEWRPKNLDPRRKVSRILNSAYRGSKRILQKQRARYLSWSLAELLHHETLDAQTFKDLIEQTAVSFTAKDQRRNK